MSGQKKWKFLIYFQKIQKGKVITYNIHINLFQVICSITTMCINVHKHQWFFIDMEVNQE